MRTRTATLILLVTTTVAGAPLSVNHLMVGTGNRLFISTAQPPDVATLAALTDSSHNKDWHVTAKRNAASADIPITVTRVTWYPNSSTLEIRFDPAPLGWRDPHFYGWSVLFPEPNSVRASVDPPQTGFLSPAKNKDDANLYLMGAYLAGESTKPIYSIDAKLGFVPEIHNSGYFAGVEATVLVNSGSTPPAEQTRVDPDSLSAAVTVSFMRGDFAVSLYPARGEFSRANPDSNFVPAGTVKWILNPLFETGRHAGVFYPSIGVEAGWNLNKPNMLFQQPVDFTAYNHILRGVLGAYAAYYIKRPKPNPNDPYAFEFSTTYVGRIPATDEPFVTSQFVNGQRQALVTLDRRVRNYMDSIILWNVSTFVGLQAKYTFGSLPPLFQFTDHQVTVGVTFKARLPGHI